MVFRPLAGGPGARCAVLVAVALAWATSSGDVTTVPDGTATAVEEIVVSSPEPRYVAPTTRDRVGRIWAPVLIDGKGPYRLVLDTGASRSAVIPAVVRELGLPVRVEGTWLRGITGSAKTSTVHVGRFEVGELVADDVELLVVADAFGGAQGVLGGEDLGDKRIVIEFRNDRITIVRSHRQPAPGGYSIVPFDYALRRGMRTNVWVGRVKATAIIDTGSQVTVGNLALRQALARPGAASDRYDDRIIGVTLDVQEAATAVIPSIVAGEVIVHNAPILFSDLDIFRHWNLDGAPALLIGMDVLGALDTLIIDYKRRELQVRVRS